MIKKCKICKNKFILRSNNQKYCSEICSKLILLFQHDKARKKYRKIHKKRIKKMLKNYYKIHKKELSDKQKEYRKLHKKQIDDYMKIYNITHKKHIKKIKQIYRKTHKKQLNNAINKRKKTDINFKITCNLRSRIWDVLHRIKKSTSTAVLLGCTIEEFKQYLELHFEPGMNWLNYGRTGWHIDHIRPCVSFDLSKPEEQRKCFHYTNLQPLWAIDNQKKYIS